MYMYIYIYIYGVFTEVARLVPLGDVGRRGLLMLHRGKRFMIGSTKVSGL